MLRVTLELLPADIDGRRETVGHVDIANVAEMDGVGTYHVTGKKLGRAHSAMLLGHRKSDGPWVLVAKALDALGWGR
jgi:hypothetical protein